MAEKLTAQELRLRIEQLKSDEASYRMQATYLRGKGEDDTAYRWASLADSVARDIDKLCRELRKLGG